MKIGSSYNMVDMGMEDTGMVLVMSKTMGMVTVMIIATAMDTVTETITATAMAIFTTTN